MFALALFIASILAANVAIETFGVVPVGFGLMAPAAVYVVGVTLLLRDLVQERFGARTTLVAVLAGAVLSAAVSPQLAVASGVAFALSETLDLAVYTPLRRRNLLGAVAASNAVGLVVDSLVFLTLAFGSLAFLPGQIVGKTWASLVGLVLIAVWQKARNRRLTAPAPATA